MIYGKTKLQCDASEIRVLLHLSDLWTLHALSCLLQSTAIRAVIAFRTIPWHRHNYRHIIFYYFFKCFTQQLVLFNSWQHFAKTIKIGCTKTYELPEKINICSYFPVLGLPVLLWDLRSKWSSTRVSAVIPLARSLQFGCRINDYYLSQGCIKCIVYGWMSATRPLQNGYYGSCCMGGTVECRYNAAQYGTILHE